MKFKCPACGTVKERDMRRTLEKSFYSKRGYKSYCIKKDRNVFMKQLGRYITKLSK